MKKSPQLPIAIAVLVAAGGLSACGMGLFDFAGGGGGGGGGQTGDVSVTGNIQQVAPATSQDIVVFVYSGNDPSGNKCPVTSTTASTSTSTTLASAVPALEIENATAGGTCNCPAAPVDPECTPGKAVILPSGQTTFTVGGVVSGKIRVVFLLDNSGSDADARIDPGDPIAVLDDVQCQLGNVNGKTTVTLTDVDLDFSSAPTSDCEKGVANPPAPGRARAGDITKGKTPSSG